MGFRAAYRAGAPGLARMAWQSAASCALLAALGACSTRADGVEWAGTMTDSAGVVIVTNPERGLWGDDQAWTLQEELRIGTFAEDADYQFGQIGAIAVNSAGEILAIDRQAREVRVFSPTGTFLRSMGSPGSAPGELGRGVTDVFVAPGDTVLVPDVRNRRINRFRSDGTSLGSMPLVLRRGRPLRFDYQPISGAMTVQIRPIGGGAGSSVDTMDAIRSVDASGALGDTLLRVPSGGLLGPNGRVAYFTPEPMWDISDSSTVLYGVNDAYRIVFHDQSGAARRVVTRPFVPRPITDRDIRAFFAYLDRAWLAAGVSPARLEVNHRAVSFAAVFPAFSEFHVGYRGSLWVQPVRAPGDLTDEEIDRYNFIEDFGASTWDVFDAEGRFLGVVTMPDRFQPRLFSRDVIYGVQRDELDVQYVVRLRITVPE